MGIKKPTNKLSVLSPRFPFPALPSGQSPWVDAHQSSRFVQGESETLAVATQLLTDGSAGRPGVVAKESEDGRPRSKVWINALDLPLGNDRCCSSIILPQCAPSSLFFSYLAEQRLYFVANAVGQRIPSFDRRSYSVG